MKQAHFKETLSQIDKFLKEARFGEAHSFFSELNKEKCPREFLSEFCMIARRLNLPYVMLKKLNSVINPELPLETPASTIEKALYANALTRIGAFGESQKILRALPNELPQAHFYLANNYIVQWQYPQAILPLKRYLNLLQPEQYEYWIAKINLLSVYTATSNYEVAEDMAREMLQNLDLKYQLLMANTLEVYAQILVNLNRYREAHECLTKASKLFKSTSSYYHLFILKWNLVIQMRQKNEVDEPRFQKLKLLAKKNKHFETLREMDFYRSIYLKDQDLFRKVYLGTRMSAYRKKMLSSFDIVIKSGPVEFNLAETSSEEILIDSYQLDLTAQAVQLLDLIFSDYYSPIQLGEVFRELYPNEFFNPDTSVKRLYLSFNSLRKQLDTRASLPFQIFWQKRQLLWQGRNNFSWYCHFGQKKPNLRVNKMQKGYHLVLAQLPIVFSTYDFSILAKNSLRQAHRQLQWALKGKSIKKLKPGVYQKNEIKLKSMAS
jgi:tetratricopeptide (TPR) repeat protein